MKETKTAKVVIVVDGSLDMPAGKLAAQVAHAVENLCLQYTSKAFNWPAPAKEYADDGWTKVVVRAKDSAEMEVILEKLKQKKIPQAKIIDEGRTVFNGTPTWTVLGIGPYWNEDIDRITGHLPLY